MNVQPRHLAAGTALLALVPVALYVADKSTTAAVALVNVVLVAGCLYYLFGPSDGEDGHAAQ
ncbi:hypothetical protein [Halobacterium yunchengense]|uniref:hypothetical protein n=1 Tax=Halobacterium yunchengense TaxID=3108497 RepID=UPI0030095C1B